MTNKAKTKTKAKEYAERIAEINRQVETGTVNFEQARVTIDTYKWLASKYDPGTLELVHKGGRAVQAHLLLLTLDL